MAFYWTARVAARQGRRVFALIAFITAWVTGGPAFAATTVQSVAMVDDRIVISFDAPVGDATSYIVNATRQIVVDVAGVMPGSAATTGGPISGVSQVRSDDGTKLLFDLTSPAVIRDGQFDQQGRQLTLMLDRANEKQFALASRAGPMSFFTFDFSGWSRKSAATTRAYKVVQDVPPATRGLPLPPVSGDDARPLVVIDAGHGGFDPGAINEKTGLREKDVTLRIAKAIRDQLLASGRVRVALTRDDDKYLVLRERYSVARRLHADLFISIHCDSAASPDATGSTAYTLSEVSSDKEAARLAARENKVDVINGVNLDEANPDVSSILIDLTQRETMNASAGFARLLGREAKPLIPTKSVFHRMASLMVLKAPDTPSILFETGYISNAADSAFLDSAQGRDKIAESVTRAVELHFARRFASR
ncbi:MAG: N-acetylmuramoyl-L-alanine amidase [Sphingomonas bacterium]|nr:N-acetylmuramoyl-L-alanine amidase [Sphingomonas bacterium]